MAGGPKWGSGFGGGAAPAAGPPPNTFVSPLYPVPRGQVLGSVPVGRFSGEPTSGPLSGAQGAVFFSPSLLQQNDTNEIDLDLVQVSVRASDAYERPPEEDFRVFTFGPNSISRTNDPAHRSQPGTYTAVATMVQTIPPGPTTVFKIP